MCPKLPLQIKALALLLATEQYRTDSVANEEKLKKGSKSLSLSSRGFYFYFYSGIHSVTHFIFRINLVRACLNQIESILCINIILKYFISANKER